MFNSDLHQALKDIRRDIERLSGLEVTWKDADPQNWTQIPPALSQHCHQFCATAKSKPSRMQQCAAHCNYPRTPDGAFGLKTCPFGIRELRIPLSLGGHYLGTLSVGPWQSEKTGAPQATPMDADLQRIYTSLNGQDDSYAQALARCILPRLELCALKSSNYFKASYSANSAINSVTNSATNPAHNQRLTSCLTYIDESLNLQLRAGSVASHLNISHSRFIHWFKESTNSCYRDYLQQKVLQRAASALLQTSQRIIEIAYDCGYHSPSAFAAAFKNQYHMQPSKFRKKYMNTA